jgi:23S rRNA pseudouridine1911/1915/1917 synthase
MQIEPLYHDNHLLVVRKPACVPTVPDASGDESLLDAARAWVEREYAKPGRAFLGVVHRLDRSVSGIVVFARTSKAASRLAGQLRAHELRKVYWGISDSEPRCETGVLEQWLVKDRRRNLSRATRPASPGSKRAVTRWRVLRGEWRVGRRRVLMELVPETGRAHQLRIAAASLGAPLLGDLKYGAREPLPDRSIALHAHAIELRHPTRDELVEISCAPPEGAVWNLARGLGDA